MSFIVQQSSHLYVQNDSTKDPIYAVTQFFIHSDPQRNAEIQMTLRKNVENKYIRILFLLNERIYTDEELGIQSDVIVQINIGKRLHFCDVFDFVRKQLLKGYIVFMNADIVIDETIQCIQQSILHLTPSLVALQRYEYIDGIPTITNYNGTSQDTWIYHSNQNMKLSDYNRFDFPFGKMGCDNVFLYLLNELGYQLFNVPQQIRTYHQHANHAFPYYNLTDLVEGNQLFLLPF